MKNRNPFTDRPKHVTFNSIFSEGSSDLILSSRSIPDFISRIKTMNRKQAYLILSDLTLIQETWDSLATIFSIIRNSPSGRSIILQSGSFTAKDLFLSFQISDRSG